MEEANKKISQRDRVWDSMTREEKLNYLATTKDKGNKRYVLCFAVNEIRGINTRFRLDFRFAS
jgi:hypothetical protein